MYKDKKIIAIIPARGGSKGVPGKNIKLLYNKPLIAWSIDEAKKSKYIDTIFVSTDDNNIADVARQYGIKIPFLRDSSLARDDTPSMDVILNVLEHFEKNGDSYDLVIMLEPTSPLRNSNDIDSAITMLVETAEAKSIVGVCKVEATHPDFCVKIENGFLRRRNNEDFKVIRRQDLDELYFYEGSLYISYVDYLKESKSFYHNKTLGFVVPRWKSPEIDDILDFVVVEAIMKAKEQGIIQ